MTTHHAWGFAKQAGIGSFVSSAIGKVKSLFGGGGGSVGAQVVKLRPKAPAAAMKPGLSIATPMKVRTPAEMAQRQNVVQARMARREGVQL